MRMRLSLPLAVMLALAGPLHAETALPCAEVTALVQELTGLALPAPPSAPDVDGWCSIPGARLSAPGGAEVSVRALRLRGSAAEGVPVMLALALEGARLTPGGGAADLPLWVQDMLRLQTADVALLVQVDPAGDGLDLRSFTLALSGGTELELQAQLSGAGLTRAALVTARLTRLTLRWKADGRLPGPALAAAGQALGAAPGAPAQAAARAALQGLAEGLPDASLSEGSAEALQALIGDLPEGRGRLELRLGAPQGIGAASVARLALADDPSSPEALGRFLEGVSLSVDWRPGLQP
jgi:hypothetical protein